MGGTPDAPTPKLTDEQKDLYRRIGDAIDAQEGMNKELYNYDQEAATNARTAQQKLPRMTQEEIERGRRAAGEAERQGALGFKTRREQEAAAVEAAGRLSGIARDYDPRSTDVLDRSAQFLERGADAAFDEFNRSASDINPNIDNLRGIAGRFEGIADRTEDELSGLRKTGLSQLEEIQKGRIPDAIRNLVTPAGGVSERDILEAQFGNASQNIAESGGQRGSGLSRNLANAQAQRALSLAEQEARRDEAERQAGLGLYNQALNQGLTANQQVQESLGLGAQAYSAAGAQTLGAEQLRQDALGLSGSLSAGAGQADLAGAQNERANTALGAQLNQADVAARLGIAGQAGGDAADLSFRVAPGLGTRNIQLQEGLARSYGIERQIARGGGGSNGNTNSLYNAAGQAIQPIGAPAAGPNGNAALGAGAGGVVGGLLGLYYSGGNGQAGAAGAGIGSNAGGIIGGLF